MFRSKLVLKILIPSLIFLAVFVVLVLVTSFEVLADTSSGLVGYWKFDENQGISTSDSIGSSNGILVNGPSWTDGKLGSGISFDGVDDRVEITSSENINNLTSITISTWVFPKSAGGNGTGGGRIISKGDGSPKRFALLIASDGSSVGFLAGYTGSVGGWKTSSGTLPMNKWSHVAVTYTYGNPSNIPTIYINGIPQTLTNTYIPSGGPVADDSKLYIGSKGTDKVFDGIIDEVRIYNRVLNSVEINEIRSSEMPPNIIVIMTDDQDDGPTMKYMDKVKRLIADKGVVFSNSFVDNPLCCPSRATFLTGQCSHNHKAFFIAPTVVFNNKTYYGGYSAIYPTADNTLPVWLKKAGYKTAMIGKYVNGYGSQTDETVIPLGWDKWFAWSDKGGMYQYYNYRVNDNGVIRTFGNSPSDYATDKFTEEAIEFIEENANSGQPFFLYINYFAPHETIEHMNPDDDTAGLTVNPPKPAPRHQGTFSGVELPRPPSFNEADVSDKPGFMQDDTNPLMDARTIDSVKELYQKRLESLLSVDEGVEKIINKMESLNKLSNSFVIYTSDNGFFHGEHRRPTDKRLVYEESIRVPLIIRGPGVPAGEKRNQLVVNVDLPATIIDIAHAQAGRSLDGKSLLPLIQNSSYPWRTAILVEGSDKLHFIPFNPNIPLYGIYSAVRTNRYLYAEHETRSGQIDREFYDLLVDPYQLSNNYNNPTYASVINSLQATLNALKNCTGASCWITTPEPNLLDNIPPNTPVNLVAAPISSSQINLSWVTSTDNVGVAGYKIYRCQGSDCSPNIQIATTNSTLYQDTGLAANTIYTYAVSAYDSEGNVSNKSIPVSAKTFSLPTNQCSPASVPNGTVSPYPDCKIICNSGYVLSGNSCVAVSKGGGGGGGNRETPGPTPNPTSPQTSLEQLKTEIQLAQQSLLSLILMIKNDPKNPQIPTLLAAISKTVNDLFIKIQQIQSKTNISDSPFTFSRNLFLGSQGDDVKKLQEFLAKDKSLYPEGKITGYFGFLTQKAIERFQCKYSIICYGTPYTTGYGAVDAKTRAKLNELIKSQ